MPAEEWEAAERVIARLIARAYVADHPELFGPRLSQGVQTEDPAVLSFPQTQADES